MTENFLPILFCIFSLTRDKDVIDILIVMVDGNGGDALAAHRGQHTPGPIALAGRVQFHRHVHRLLQNCVHPDDALGQRLVAEDRARLVPFPALQRDEQSVAVPLDKVRVLQAEVEVQVRFHGSRWITIIVVVIIVDIVPVAVVASVD